MKKVTFILFILLINTVGNSLFGQTKLLNKDSLLSEIDILFSSIDEIHPDMYSTLAKSDFDNELALLKSSIKKDMNVFDYYKLIAPLVSKLGDGHTGVYFSKENLKDPNLLFFPFPVEISYKDSTVTTTRDLTKSKETIPIGATILSINNKPAKKLIAEMMTYISAERDFYKMAVLKYYFTLLLYVSLQTDEYQIEYVYNDEERHKIKVKGISYFDRFGQPSQKENKQKVKNYSFIKIPENNIGIIDFRSFSDLNSFKVFLDSTFSIIRNDSIENLIIDTRENSGGSSSLGDELFQYISPVPFRQYGKTSVKISDLQKEYYKKNYGQKSKSKNGIKIYDNLKLIKLRKNKLHYNGNLYLLISHLTFSSASNFSWAFKYFEMGTVVGEETGGMSVSFGDAIKQKLPYSNLDFIASYKRFTLYGATEKNIHGTIPDYEIRSKDALNFTIELIKKEKTVNNK
jgi:C-terminal processing protease CtpA/Prc